MFQSEDNLSRQFHECFGLLMKYRHAKAKEFFRENPEETPDKKFLHRPPHRGQHKLLCILLKQDGLSQRDIVHEMDIRPSSVTELVAKLEDAGYVRKEEDGNDKRVSNIFLTDTGREQAEKIAQSRNASEGELFAALSGEEKSQFSALLQKINTDLKEKTAGIEGDEGIWGGPMDFPHDGHHRHGRHGRHGCGKHGRHHHGHGRSYGAMRCGFGSVEENAPDTQV